MSQDDKICKSPKLTPFSRQNAFDIPISAANKYKS